MEETLMLVHIDRPMPKPPRPATPQPEAMPQPEATPQHMVRLSFVESSSEPRGFQQAFPSGISIPEEVLARIVLDRLPLAEAVLLLFAQVLKPEFLQAIFQRHRGRSFEDVLTFPTLVDLLADALLTHHGSARQSLEHSKERGTLPSGFGAFYGKLRRIPLSLSL